MSLGLTAKVVLHVDLPKPGDFFFQAAIFIDQRLHTVLQCRLRMQTTT